VTWCQMFVHKRGPRQVK